MWESYFPDERLPDLEDLRADLTAHGHGCHPGLIILTSSFWRRAGCPKPPTCWIQGSRSQGQLENKGQLVN